MTRTRVVAAVEGKDNAVAAVQRDDVVLDRGDSRNPDVVEIE